MATIELDGVTKRFGDTVAVDHADFTIEEGEFFILVGPSGCGKSTLLNMIVGLEDVTEGEIRVDGEPVTGTDPKDRNMAMVFQSYAIYPHMTVRENMAFPLDLAGWSDDDIDRKVDEAAELLEISNLLDRYPKALSGGQRQRVAMGRAIVRDPVAFLMDEPLSNLDAKLRVQMRTEVARLQRNLGTTTVYVTHDQTEAMTLGSRVAVLRGGIVQQVASPRELYTRPANTFVAGFIGSPAMNFLPGELDGNRVHLPFGDAEVSPGWTEALGERRGDVVVGARPEHFEDAAIAGERDHGIEFEAEVEVLEWLGSDLYAHFTVEGVAEEVAELFEEIEQTPQQREGHSMLVARLDPESKAAEGERMRFWLDTHRIVAFDGETGENLTRPRDEH